MTPREAEKMQADIFRRMRADEKVDVMVGMWNFAHEINQSGWYGSEAERACHNLVNPSK
ncbi:MAG: hypothetical protein WC654_00575 [Patescibacteria group bacterium]